MLRKEQHNVTDTDRGAAVSALRQCLLQKQILSSGAFLSLSPFIKSFSEVHKTFHLSKDADETRGDLAKMSVWVWILLRIAG